MRHRQAIGKIKRLLFNKGMTCAAIDRRFGLYKNQASDALYEPNIDGENAIAKVLNKKPHVLWPHRFDENNERLSPQPESNYRTRKNQSQRQKREAA